MSSFGRAILLSGLLLAGAPSVAGDIPTAVPVADAFTSDVSDQELFEMCCWAQGRAGFNHCVEYGVCKDHPEKGCKGRGPAEGRSMSCDAPPKEASSRADPSARGDYFLLFAPASSGAGL